MTVHIASPTTEAPPSGAPGGRLRAIWNGIVGAIAAVVGLAPHVLHHIGLLAGTALVAGAAGTALFGVIGLVASIPFLLRLQRRFHTWRAPAVALVVFAAMFSLSAFVVGPALRADSGTGTSPGVTQSTPAPIDHSAHHGGP